MAMTPLLHEGHKYWKNKLQKGKLYYFCACKRNSGCPATLVQTIKEGESDFKVSGEHTCTQDHVWGDRIGEMEASDRDIKIKHPCTIMVAGPTGSGKTVLVRKLLQDHANLFDNINSKELKLTWCYGQWQSSYSVPVPNVKIDYVDGLIDQTYIEQKRPHLVVIDDLMTELGGDKSLANLFTKGSHHLGISIIFIVQNVFHQAPQMRTISLNSHYMLLLKNPRDKSQIMSLARQLYPTNMKYLQEVYKDATSRPFGYLLLDLTPDTPEELRCRTLITSSDVPAEYKKRTDLCPIVYQEDGRGGKFTKSYSIVDRTSKQYGGQSVSKRSNVSDCNDESDNLSNQIDINTEQNRRIEKGKQAIQPSTPREHATDLRECLHRLDVIARTKDGRRRRTLLREVSNDEKIHRTLRFLAQNTINMRIPLERHHKKRLIKHHEVMKQLAKNRVSKVKSKQLVEQSGGILPVLVPIAVEIVSDILGEYI